MTGDLLSIRHLSITCAALISLLATGAYGYEFAGGNGTVEDPYQIATAQQLIAIGSDRPLWNLDFILIADIDLEGVPLTNDMLGDFSGTFDGNGHVIRHLRANGIDDTGLFHTITKTGLVIDLGIVDADITGTVTQSGKLIGYDTGAIAGESDGMVCRCYATGIIRGGSSVGGLVGRNTGVVFRSYATAEVTGQEMVGGLVGYSEVGMVSGCYSTGKVNGVTQVGGVAGINNGVVINCWSTGTVAGTDLIGGLVGMNNVRTIHCYSAGSVAGTKRAGGLVGLNSGSVSGLWDIETSGQQASQGGVGLTTSQMKDRQTYLDAGWDLDGESANGTSCLWQMPAEGGYPMLSGFGGEVPVLEGSGTLDDPYLITTAEELAAVAWTDPFACYRLATDLDLASSTWSEAPIPVFAGVFDGNAHVIRNLRIAGDRYLGLFGWVGTQSRIHDLGVTDVNITGTGPYVGALAGQSGTIANCYGSGVVTGRNYTGGLVGLQRGTLTCSYAGGEVHGSDLTGGFVGQISGRVVNCYCASTVSGSGTVGGFVGNMLGEVRNCYATGRVIATGYSVGGFVGHGYGNTSDTGVTGCFWDVQTSGQTKSAAGTGLNAAEMHTVTPYANAGWDFAGRRQDGTSETWYMPPGGGYPLLSIFSSDMPPLAGQGTAAEPYLIATAEDFGRLASDPLACYQLTADIDLSGISWSTAVVPWFGGVLDGDHHELRGLRITGNRRVGLFTAVSDSARIEHLHIVNADVAAGGRYADYVGVLAALNSGDIEDCSVTGSMTGSNYIGGLVGDNSGRIADCHTTITIKGGTWVGGIAGRHSGTQAMIRCRGDSTIHGSALLGGLVGSNNGPISDCTSTATVEGVDSIGGLVGQNTASIIASRSDCTVQGHASIGGLVGWNDKDISDSNSTSDVSGLQYVGGLVGTNTGRVTNCQSTADASGQWLIGGLIGDNAASARVTGCITSGTVTATQHQAGGLIGLNKGTVADCASHSSVTAYRMVGGLIGTSQGPVSTSYSDGNANGEIAIGGLIGSNEARLTDCYSHASVTATGGNKAQLGGLIGCNSQPVIHCYSTGRPVGIQDVGGLIGLLGRSGSAIGSFWDTVTSHQLKSATGSDWAPPGWPTGTGRATTQMQTIFTFLDAAWDFDKVWTICEGKDYPRLQWEDRPCPP